MLETIIIDRELISPERLRDLQTRVDGPGIRRLLVQGSLYCATGVALVLARDGWQIALLLVANAWVQFGMFGMLHESGHKSAFATPWLNVAAGWISSLAQPMSPALFRAFHFEHHRHTHDLSRDPELRGFEFMARWPRGITGLVSLTGIPILAARVGWTVFAALCPKRLLWDRVLPFVRPERRRRVAWEARALVAVHASVAAAAILLMPELGRIYLAMLLGHTFLAVYTACEHRGLPEEGSILDRTRSLEVSEAFGWWLWNMPYHAEHHAWPAVPFHSLPSLHAAVRQHVVHRDRPLYLHFHAGRSEPRESAGAPQIEA